MNITLPEEMRSLLEDRARRAGLESVEEYVLRATLGADPEEVRQTDVDSWLRECLAAGRDPAAVPAEEVTERWREIETALIEGLRSGPAVEATPAFWAERRRVLEERRTRRQNAEET